MKTLKKAVDSGELIQDKSSYKIPGEVYELPADETVQVFQQTGTHRHPFKSDASMFARSRK